MMIQGNEKYIVFGVGKSALGMHKYLARFYNILGYYDSDSSLWGTIFFDKTIFNKSQVAELCNKYQDEICFIISPVHAEIVEEITRIIKTEFGKSKIIDKDALQNDIIKRRHKEMELATEAYQVNFIQHFRQWTENLTSEVEYWIKQSQKNGYCVARSSNLNVNPAMGRNGENIFNYLGEGAILIDIGCGVASKYGNILPNGSRVNLIAVDPLAYIYNKINEYHALENKKKVTFGMFEFAAVFFEKDFADVILIENALDHCVDPVKSLIECLQILKPGGLLRLWHHRAEALWEGCLGLHKWNIDYNCDNDLIFWNDDNYININKFMGENVDIKVFAEGDGQRDSQYVTAELVKKSSYDYLNYINLEEENTQLGQCISSLMEYMAETCYHYL